MAILGLLFIEGVRAVTRDGLSRHRGFIVGLSLSVAVGLQSQPSFLDLLGGPVAALLGNGVLVGVGIAVLLTGVFEVTSARRQRFETVLDDSAFGDLDGFLHTLGDGMGWNSASVERLRAAGGRDADRDDAAARGQPRRCAAEGGAECSTRHWLGRAGVPGAVLRGEHRRSNLLSERASGDTGRGRSVIPLAAAARGPRSGIAGTTASMSSPSRSKARRHDLDAVCCREGNVASNSVPPHICIVVGRGQQE